MLALSLISLAATISATPTGVKFYLSQNAINRFTSSLLPNIISDLSEMTLEDETFVIAEHSFFRVVGKIKDFSVDFITLDYEVTRIELQEPSSIELNISKLNTQMSFKWSYDSRLGSDEGRAVITFGSDFQIKIGLSEKDGHPIFQITQSTCRVSDFQIKLFDSPIAQMVDWLLSIFQPRMITSVESNFARLMDDSVNQQLMEILSNIPLVLDISDSGYEVNYTLPEAPQIEMDALIISSYGLIVNAEHPDVNPPIPKPVTLPQFNPNDMEIQLAVTEYTINSGLYAAHTGGDIQYFIPSEAVPSNPFFKLNTTDLDALLPGIKKTFGPNKKCDITCKSKEAPLFDFYNPTTKYPGGKFQGYVSLECSVSVRDQGVAISLLIQTDVVGSVYLESWVIKGTVESLLIDDIKVENNNIGDEIDADSLKGALNLAIGFALPTIDKQILGPGIPLPAIEGVDLRQSSIKMYDGYILVQATPSYGVTEERVNFS